MRHVAEVDTGVVVYAESLEASWKGKEALDVGWDAGVRPEMDSATIEERMIGDLDRRGVLARNDGDTAGALAGARRRVEAKYQLPFLSHATMEPMNCTAHVRPDGWDVWVPTQAPSRVLDAVAEVTGLDPEQIRVHTPYLGCGLGRRGRTDCVREAVQAARAVEEPVKVVWRREEDMGYDLYRPASAHRIAAAIDGGDASTPGATRWWLLPSTSVPTFPGSTVPRFPG